MPEKPDPRQTEFDFTPRPLRGDLARSRASLEDILRCSYLKDLQSESWRARRKAAKGLGDLGPAAREAAPELQQLLCDREEKVRRAAVEALAKITPEGAG